MIGLSKWSSFRGGNLFPPHGPFPARKSFPACKKLNRSGRRRLRLVRSNEKKYKRK